MDSNIKQRTSDRSKRRTILKSFFGISLTAVLSPVLYVVGRYLGYRGSATGSNNTLISATEVSAEHPSKLLDINDEPVLVVYETDKGLRAFDAKCTHLGCTVSFVPDQPGFYCKCHHGKYDLDGVNVPGTRPKRPLTELTITQKGDQLEVSLTPKSKAS